MVRGRKQRLSVGNCFYLCVCVSLSVRCNRKSISSYSILHSSLSFSLPCLSTRSAPLTRITETQERASREKRSTLTRESSRSRDRETERGSREMHVQDLLFNLLLI